MKNLLVGLILFGLTSQAIAQEGSQEAEELDEIAVTGVNYRYLNDIGASEAAEPVKILERKVANFDVKNLDFYEDENQIYSVYFNIPKGRILAIYDGETNEILSTAEKFTDVRLPFSVYNSLIDNYPGWKIVGDIYRVSYKGDRGTKKTYIIYLEKDGKYKKVKTDDNGVSFSKNKVFDKKTFRG